MRWVLAIALCACSFSPRGIIAGDDPDAPIGDDDAPQPPPPDGDDPPDAEEPAAIVQNGLIEDLDADLGITGDGSVNIWANQASGGDDVTVGAGTVTVLPDVVNGHAALRFPGTARLIGDDTAVFCPLTSGTGLTWFAVVQSNAQDSPTRNQILGTIREGTPFSGFTGGVNTSTARPYTMMRPTTIETFAQSTRNTANQWAVLAGRLSAGTGAQTTEVYVSSKTPDATGAVNVPGTSMCGGLVIGSERTQGTEFYTGDVTRVLIYGRPLSDGELAITGRALAQRYAITATF